MHGLKRRLIEYRVKKCTCVPRSGCLDCVVVFQLGGLGGGYTGVLGDWGNNY